MRFGIRFQITSVSIAVIVATALGLALTNSIILQRTLRSRVSERTSQIEPVLRGALSTLRREIEHQADLWANNESLRNQFHYESWTDVGKTLKEVRQGTKVDVVLAIDSEGELQAYQGADAALAKRFASSLTRKAVKGTHGAALLEPIGDKLYFVSFEEVVYFGNHRGLLMLARALTDEIAAYLKKQVGAEVIAFGADRIYAGTQQDPELGARLQEVWKALAQHKPVDLGSISLGNQGFYAIAVPIEHQDQLLEGLFFALPEAEITVAQRRTVLGALGLAALITVIGTFLGLSMAGRISKPIVAMADQFSRISASADLALRVDESAKNEIGDMARSFNSMQDRVEQLHVKVAHAEERMRKELQMASTVQEFLFQQEMPHNRVCDVAAYSSTLVETSGDWYGVYDDPAAEQTIFIVADATGHGASAALITAITNGFFQTLWFGREHSGASELSQLEPSEILRRLSRVVLSSARGSVTATAFFGRLDHKTRELTYSTAGHTPPLVTSWATGELKTNLLMSNPSSSIGSSENPSYTDYRIKLNPETLVLLYSDGLSEAENAQGIPFGARRILAVLKNCRHSTVEEIRQRMLDALNAFRGETELNDDTTYMVVRVN